MTDALIWLEFYEIFSSLQIVSAMNDQVSEDAGLTITTFDFFTILAKRNMKKMT